MINVSWDDARAYAAWLSEGTGKRFRLPTEAEWEYAARAVTPTTRFWGDAAAEACRYANVFDRRNASSLKERLTGVNWEAFACEDAYADIAPVGSFQPNPWGLHDMLGNVFEWVQDCWHDSYEGAPADGTAWEGGDCARRLYRGGSWIDAPGDVRSAHRVRYKPGDRGSALGFRLAQDL